MRVGCEVKINLRAESRFSPDDITRFDDSDENAAFSEFASRVCNYFDSYYMERHGRGHGMRVKGNRVHGSGSPIALWTIQRDGNVKKDRPRQVSVGIASPILIYDMTQAWRDAVKSMYRSIGDRYLLEGNVSYRQKIHAFHFLDQVIQAKMGCPKFCGLNCKDFMLKILIECRKAVAYVSFSSPRPAGT